MPLERINSICVKMLGLRAYLPVLEAMRQFTQTRNEHTIDELWLVEHLPVYTQGQAGKAEHLLQPGDIPVVQAERGGQVTYHGPGQLVVYPLLDLKRLRLGVRDLVSALENTVVQLLQHYGIVAYSKREAPGVYVTTASVERKIASLGLRVRRGCSFHGVAVNVDMDLSPFLRINPCGFAGLEMTQIVNETEITDKLNVMAVGNRFAEVFVRQLGIEIVVENK